MSEKMFLLQYKFETVGRSPFRYDKIQDYGGLGGGWWKMYRFFMQKRKEIGWVGVRRAFADFFNVSSANFFLPPLVRSDPF